MPSSAKPAARTAARPASRGGGVKSSNSMIASVSQSAQKATPRRRAVAPALTAPGTKPLTRRTEATKISVPVQRAAQQNEDEEYEDFDPFLFIKHLPPLPASARARRAVLPPKLHSSPPVSLVLDLDETLVHCSVQPIPNPQLTFSVNFNGVDYEVYVRTRPHLQAFLQQVSEWFELTVFTASQAVYADKLLDILDTKRQIKYRVFRDSCVCVEGNYLKDLNILGRDLAKCAIIDNSIQAFAYQLDNGIPIESWFEDEEDRELLNLLPFLDVLRSSPDVRPLIRSTFRIKEHIDSL